MPLSNGRSGFARGFVDGFVDTGGKMIDFATKALALGGALRIRKGR